MLFFGKEVFRYNGEKFKIIPNSCENFYRYRMGSELKSLDCYDIISYKYTYLNVLNSSWPVLAAYAKIIK